MSVFKIEKTKDFTIMSNYHFRDMNLSLKAKGLLSYMLSLPDDWDYSVNGLCSICKESIKAIRSILKELEDNGYLKRTKKQLENGRFSYEYNIFEIPYTQKGHTEEGHVEEDTQINTNKQNTKEQIDKGDKTNSPFFVEQEHNILTLELINRGYIEKNDTQIFYYDKLFEDLLNDNNSYKDLMIILHYIVPRVISRKFRDEDDNEIKNKFGYFKNAILWNIKLLNQDYEDLYTDDEYNWLNS